MGNNADKAFSPAACGVHDDQDTLGKAGGWRIRAGSIPLDGEITGTFLKFANPLLSMFGHNYIEIIDSWGKVQGRVHGLGFSQNENGELVSGIHGERLYVLALDPSNLEVDPFLHASPHAYIENALQCATSKNAVGKNYAADVFSGSKRDALILYANILNGAIAINNQDYRYNAFGQSESAPNSNSVALSLRRLMKNAAYANDIQGVDHNFIAAGVAPGGGTKIPLPDPITFKPDLKVYDLETYMDELYHVLVSQVRQAYKAENLKNVDVNTPPPNVPFSLAR